MSAYFQDLYSNVVLKFDVAYDIQEIRKQIGDYKEVSEVEYNAYHGIEPQKQKQAK